MKSTLTVEELMEILSKQDGDTKVIVTSASGGFAGITTTALGRPGQFNSEKCLILYNK